MQSATETRSKKPRAKEAKRRPARKPEAGSVEHASEQLLTADTEHKLPAPDEQKHELTAYERLRQEVRKLLAGARGSVNADTVKQAVDKAVEGLKHAASHSATALNKAAGVVKKDLTEAAAKMGPKWGSLSSKRADLFAVWRDRGSVFLGHAASAVADWLHEAGGKLGHRTYRAGEMTYSGILKCSSCGEQLVLRKPAHLEPCQKCGHTIFQRL